MSQLAISDVLRGFLSNGKIILDNGICEFNEKECLEDFISSKMGKMFQLSGTYSRLFKSLGIQSRKQLNLEIGKHFRSSSVKELAETLLQFEAEWDHFIDTIDVAIQAESQEKHKTFELGQHLPLDLTLVNIPHGTPVSLDQLLPTFNCPYLLLVLQRHFA
ncbi:uncharacterized protein LOC115217480 isoform X1 [Argonauta hians]